MRPTITEREGYTILTPPKNWQDLFCKQVRRNFPHLVKAQSSYKTALKAFSMGGIALNCATSRLYYATFQTVQQYAVTNCHSLEVKALISKYGRGLSKLSHKHMLELVENAFGVAFYHAMSNLFNERLKADYDKLSVREGRLITLWHETLPLIKQIGIRLGVCLE